MLRPTYYFYGHYSFYRMVPVTLVKHRLRERVSVATPIHIQDTTRYTYANRTLHSHTHCFNVVIYLVSILYYYCKYELNYINSS